MGIRKFLVALEAFVLLMWGPDEYHWVYVVSVPVASWFLLKWIWHLWQPDAGMEDRLKRTIAGAIAGGLFLGAYLATQQKYHLECFSEVKAPNDVTECLGDYKRVPGPDLERVALFTVAGVFAFSFGVSESKLWTWTSAQRIESDTASGD